MTLIARMPQEVLADPVTAAVFETDPDVAPYLVRTYRDAVSGRVFGMLVLFGLFAGMAATAALLAGVGIYGAFSFGVTARMREFGVRQAIGATTRQIRGLVYVEGWKTVVPGILIGTLGGAAISKYAVGVLYAVQPNPYDPSTYAVCGLFVVLVCGVALVIPARRASRAGESLADLLR
jgi:putative ABC transport system permease protein